MTTLTQRSFSGGEIAPSLYARTDTQKYQAGLRTCRNNQVMRHGGALSRAGTKYCCEAKYRDREVRLVPFEFSDSDTYMLEFGHLYMRVIKDGAVLVKADLLITGITTASQAVFTVTNTLANGDEVFLSGIEGMSELNGRNFVVSDVTGTTFKLKYLDRTTYVDTTGMEAYVSGGNAAPIYELVTTIKEPSLKDMQFVQSADVMFFVSHDFPPSELRRLGEINWTMEVMTFQPTIATPVGISAVAGGTTGSTSYRFVVTAVAEETNEESLPSEILLSSTGNAELSPDNYILVKWNLVSDAREYNIYLSVNGVFGYIGIARGNTFKYIGTTADTTDSPPSARNPFSHVFDDFELVSIGNWPAAVTLSQQRLAFANTVNKPETVWMSKTGAYRNFTTSIPLQADDSITFGMAGRKINAVRHILDLSKFVTLTQNTEFTIEGDGSGVILPGEINPKPQTYNGSSTLSPIVSGGNALYVQARGSIIRDLGFDYQSDGYRGSDLTIFSAHLVDGYDMVSWAYQQTPHSIIWVVRNDGQMIGLTYLREHQMLAWHRHDFEGGAVACIASIPEGEEDSLYMAIRREVDGQRFMSIERMASRQFTDIVDFIGLDSSLTYDGRNESRDFTLSSAGGWTYHDEITVECFPGVFSPSDVGNYVHVSGVDAGGEPVFIRIKITEVVDEFKVKGKPSRTVPVPMQGVDVPGYRAVDKVTNLWHLEGKQVSVFADGFVVANPHNPAYEQITVVNGSITLAESYVTIHVGLPITCDIETLDIEATQGETLIDKKINISKVWMHVEKTRGLWVGAKAPDEGRGFLYGLTEYKPRRVEETNQPPSLMTKKISIAVRPEWNSNGRVFIRQTDPVPMSILSIAPDGKIPLKGLA